jgi:NAD(P)-dependent dehydrogenase (short-subunit alcohol dehydrogenase family)
MRMRRVSDVSELLKRSSPSRIVIVASELHRVGTLDFDNLNSVNTYGVDRVYCNSKLANIVMSNELARKLKGTGIANGKTTGHTNLVQTIISSRSYAIVCHHCIFVTYGVTSVCVCVCLSN